jgi:Ca-activated chloride channel family protein
MIDLTFASPAWLWGGLLTIPLLALRMWSHCHASSNLRGLVSPKLTGQLINGNGRSQRWVVFLLRILALIALFAAISRPQLGYKEVETRSDSRNLIIAIDTSRSMMADDLAPNRLARARLAATDIVRSLPEDRIGLMAFAGRPFLQAPLTVDHEAVLEAISQLDTEVIPRGGTNLAAAAEMAVETFDESNLEQSILVIFSDGEALEGGEELERVRARASEAGMTIITVGVGTRDGSLIPEQDEKGRTVPGVFLKDREGQIIRSRLEPEAIRELAGNEGIYIHLGGESSLSRVVEEIKKGITTTREDGESRLRPIERFMWPLGAGFILLALSHFVLLLWPKARKTRSPRTAGAAAISLIIALITPTALSSDAITQGHELYLQERFDTAIRLYENALSEKASDRDRSRLQMGLGAATFRHGNYERAAEAYGGALVGSDERTQELAHYNLGNTLFRQGESGLTSQSISNPDSLQSLSSPIDQRDTTIRQWESAIEHYESALSINAKNEEAIHNREVVKKKLEELKKQQEEEQQQKDPDQGEESQDQENDDSSPQEQEDQQTNQQQKDQKSRDEDEQNNNQQPEDNSNDQKQPDDPGGDQDENQENQDPRQTDQQSTQETPEQPDAPEEGNLSAQPDQPQNTPPQQTRLNPEDVEQNPKTGYSPSEARQLLEALADETEVKPVLMPSGNENYKNW